MRVKLISEGGFSATAVMNQPLGQTWWDYLTLNELKGSLKINDDTTNELLRRHREAQGEASD
jgi:spore cortex formation protein SpoVR/YcgB (stage V sporulation)